MPKSPDPAKVFGRVLKSIRTSKAISQARLAELSGLDRTYVSLLERGLRQPTLGTLIEIASALGVSAASLVRAVEDEL